MRKIPTIFERDWNGDRSRVTRTPNADADWVFRGEGVATQKLDGTSCMIRGGSLFKRREIKSGQPLPPDFVSEGTDSETGKTVGWVPVGQGPEDAFHRDAWDRLLHRDDGTYELIGPKIQGNPEEASANILFPHGDPMLVLKDAPRSFDELAAWFATRDIEGIVWHHMDGRMAKLKLRDFGLSRQRR